MSTWGGPMCPNCGVMDGHTKECLNGVRYIVERRLPGSIPLQRPFMAITQQGADMTTPTCERCGQTLIVAGGMPEDSPHARTNYYVCPEHGTDYQRPALTAERLAELKALCEKAPAGPWDMYDGKEMYGAETLAVYQFRAPRHTDRAPHNLEVVNWPGFDHTNFSFAKRRAAAALIAASRDAIPALITRIEELEAQVPRWIPVTERLPEPGQICAVYITDDPGGGFEYEVLRYPWKPKSEYDWVAGVTHWMPLPEHEGDKP